MPEHSLAQLVSKIRTGGFVALLMRAMRLIINRLLESFQVGEGPTFIKHIEAGIEALNADVEHSLLLFSG
jgi:hypothetical protein